MQIEDLNINLTSYSATEYILELVGELNCLYKNLDTNSMNDRQLFLEGQKDMLEQVITYIKKTL